MNPEDDPEARIRALERPFSDIARTSELGVDPNGGGYPPPPNYPPPPTYPPTQGWYGGPQFPAPPQGPKRNHLGLIIGVVTVGLIALAAGLVVAGTNVFTNGVAVTNPTRPSGGGGSFDPFPSPASSKPEPTPSPAEPEAPLSPGDRVSVSGIGERRTLACNDNVVSISGVSNTVTITGNCARVDVSGVSNVITVDSAATINASGFENRITFHSGEPEIGNSGSGNVVERG
ncbi:DUF3060 domain-containing protein [soil metagenome]